MIESLLPWPVRELPPDEVPLRSVKARITAFSRASIAIDPAAMVLALE